MVFAVSESKELFLIDQFKETPASFLTASGVMQGWKVTQRSHSDLILIDGSMCILTPVDVLFLILPILEKQVTKGKV